MKAFVNRCDICGHDADQENPVDIRISQVGKARRRRNMYELFGSMGDAIEFEGLVVLDLCRECGTPFLQMLQMKKTKSQVKQAEETIGLDLLKAQRELGESK